MHLSVLTALLLTLSTSLSAISVSDTASTALTIHEPSPDQPFPIHNLEKGRGGGGGGGRGGSGGGGGKPSNGGGGSSSNSRPIASYPFSSTSTSGGRTRDGSSPPPPYSGRYTGGALVPFRAGALSPTDHITPYAFSLSDFDVFPAPGLWLYDSLWAYPYPILYQFILDGQNHSAPVVCLCQRHSVCGCDPVINQTFVDLVVGLGKPVNTSDVKYVAWPNGTEAAYINGTLPNGTTSKGGTGPSNAGEIGVATVLNKGRGYAAVVAMVVVAGLMTVVW